MEILFRAIVGSQAYGTSTPESDVDYKGIYACPTDELLGFNYREQIEISKDETYYELRRFLQLAQSANPTILELLYSPADCILESSSVYDFIKNQRSNFLTKVCGQSFGGYAVAQIKKAKGLDKKINYEKNRVERKGPLDFCYIYENGKTVPVSKWLEREQLKQEFIGLAKLDHIRDCYAVYYDYQAQYGKDSDIRAIAPLGYHGIVSEDSNEVRLSNIPKYVDAITLLYFNKDGYSVHCKDFNEYTTWLENRNVNRYVDTTKHGQKIDGKNLMHCVRLIDMAKEIALDGNITVRRPNAEYLLSIRRGQVSLEEIIEKAEQDIRDLDRMYLASSLPDNVDKEWVNELLLQIRHFTNKL